MFLMSLSLLLDSNAAAQETWPAGYVPIELVQDCLPVDNCPLQAFAGSGAAWSVLNDDGSWVENVWDLTPYSVSAPLTTTFRYPMYADRAGTSGNSELACGVLEDGELDCWSAVGAMVNNHPVGEGPYSSVDFSSTARYVALNGLGEVQVWGDTSGNFATNAPTNLGYTAVAVGPFSGCAAGIPNGGVDCWYANSSFDFHSSSSRPSSGTYTSLALSRCIAMAVKDDGTVAVWGPANPNSTCVASVMNAFMANAPVAGSNILAGRSVVSVDITESGTLVGMAWLDDGSAYFWTGAGTAASQVMYSPGRQQNYGIDTNGDGIDDDLSSAYNIPGTSAYYVAHGPNGVMTFRSAPQFSNLGSDWACAVIDNPQGLTYGSNNVSFEYGDAICWSGSTSGWPVVRQQCTSL